MKHLITLLAKELDQWCHAHSDKIHDSFVRRIDDVIYLVACQSENQHDTELMDKFFEFEYALAQDERFNGLHVTGIVAPNFVKDVDGFINFLHKDSVSNDISA